LVASEAGRAIWSRQGCAAILSRGVRPYPCSDGRAVDQRESEPVPVPSLDLCVSRDSSASPNGTSGSAKKGIGEGRRPPEATLAQAPAAAVEAQSAVGGWARKEKKTIPHLASILPQTYAPCPWGWKTDRLACSAWNESPSLAKAAELKRPMHSAFQNDGSEEMA